MSVSASAAGEAPARLPRPRQVALGVCVQAAGVLLVRRPAPPYAGRWSLPGAAPRRGEGMVEACRRAFRGLPLEGVTVGDLRLLIDLMPEDAPVGAEATGATPAPRWVVAVFLCHLPAGGPLPAKAALFPQAALPRGLLATDRRFISDALAGGPYGLFRRGSVRWETGQPVLSRYG